MGQDRRGISRGRRWVRWLLLLAYVPASCCLVGLAVYLLRSNALTTESHALKDVFWRYAVPTPGTLSGLHLPALALGFFALLLLMVMADSKKPVVTLLQIRIILMVLMVLISLIAKTAFPFMALSMTEGPTESVVALDLVLLALFAGIDLILVYLLTFLPIFRGIKDRPA